MTEPCSTGAVTSTSPTPTTTASNTGSQDTRQERDPDGRSPDRYCPGFVRG